MEIPSRAGSSWRRRDLLRLFAAAPAVVALSTACTAEPKQPDALLALATAAKEDAALAKAVAAAHSDLADAAGEIAEVRAAHARALQREIDRVNPPDPDAGPSVPEARPRQAPGSSGAAAEALRGALRQAQDRAAGLAPSQSGYRAGLVGSVSASCASLLEVLG